MKCLDPHAADANTRSPFHLFDKMMEGFALCEIICDAEGRPCDFRYLLVNEGFERLIGLKREEVLGRTAQELFPGIEPMWIENYGRVALDGQSARFEGYLAPLQRHFEVNAHCPQRGQFAAIFLDITDRKTMMECLCASEERYRLLVENSNDLVCEVDATGRYLYLSPNYAAVMGYGPEELRGKSCFELVHPDHIEEALEKFALPSGMLVFRSRHKDGSWRWLETTGKKFMTSGGEEREVLVSRDITGRRESEQRLRQLSQAVEHSPAAVVITNRRGDIEYVNPKFTETSGYTFEEVIGKNPRILKSGEFSPGDYKALWKKITSGQEWRGEFHNKKKNGELHWESASISPIVDDNGRITHFVAVKEDITERKKMEDSLRESEALFRAMSEASPLGIVLVDENANVVYANEAHRRISGLTLGRLVGKGWLDAVHPDDRGRAVSEWEEINRTRKPFRSERRLLRPDGKIVWISVTAAPILHKKSAEAAPVVNGYVGIVEDITEHRRMEEQALRTQRMESIGTLASGVAHDLNNILSPIMMSVDMLRADSDVPPDVREEMLATIGDCAARGADIVGQVLTFARGTQGERSVLQLRHLVKDVEKIARGTFPKSITVVNHVPRDLRPVNGDSTQLHQVLMNLCINARDAMQSGGTLAIRGENIDLDENDALACPEAKPGPYTLLHVTDTGGGIPQEIIHKIFDPFFTTKEIGKGTGLGLSTVTGIVRSHGGFVSVHSEVGKGSTFKVFLPSVVNGEADGSRKGECTVQGGRGESILVVDDEAAILEVTEALLKKHGYNVLTAANGVEAISLYVRHAGMIQVVLTDVMMPLMDGVNLARAVKKMNPALKIICTTGQAEESRQAELRALGVNFFLQKPCSAGKLLAAVHESIHG